MFLKKLGWGRTVVATITVCFAAVALTGCSVSSESVAQNELELRGFTNVLYAGSEFEGSLTPDLEPISTDKFFLSVGDCRGNATVRQNSITASFTDKEGQSIEFKDAAASMVSSDESFAFCSSK